MSGLLAPSACWQAQELMPECRALHDSLANACVLSAHCADLYRALSDVNSNPRVIIKDMAEDTVPWNISSGTLAPPLLSSRMLAKQLGDMIDNPRIEIQQELEDIFDENGAVSSARLCPLILALLPRSRISVCPIAPCDIPTYPPL